MSSSTKPVKYGVNTYIWSASFEPRHFSLLPRIREGGFDGVEIPILDPTGFNAKPIRKEAENCGLKLTAVTAMAGNASLTSSDPAIRHEGRAHIANCIRAAAELGAQVLSGPLYSPVGFFTGTRRTTDEWDMAVESWKILASSVSEYGVTIGIEPLNRFETYFLNTVDDGVAFCDSVGHPDIGLLVDTFHANIEEKNVAEAVRRAAPHLKHLHACENDRGTPGSGHVPWADFFQAVSDIGYGEWLTIESFGFSAGALSAAASIWRDLALLPELIAFDGIRFLKAGMENTLRLSA